MRAIGFVAAFWAVILGAPAWAIPVAQIGMIPYHGGVDHVDALLRNQWGNYYLTRHAHGFGPDQVKVGRFDLDGDDEAEILVMIDSPLWTGLNGQPFVIGRWTGERWAIVGAGFSGPDGIWASKDITKGWRNIEMNDDRVLVWNGRAYR